MQCITLNPIRSASCQHRLQCTADLRAQEGRPHASPLEGAVVRIKRGGSRELHRVQAVYEFRGQLRLRLQVRGGKQGRGARSSRVLVW